MIDWPHLKTRQCFTNTLAFKQFNHFHRKFYDKYATICIEIRKIHIKIRLEQSWNSNLLSICLSQSIFSGNMRIIEAMGLRWYPSPTTTFVICNISIKSCNWLHVLSFQLHFSWISFTTFLKNVFACFLIVFVSFWQEFISLSILKKSQNEVFVGLFYEESKTRQERYALMNLSCSLLSVTIEMNLLVKVADLQLVTLEHSWLRKTLTSAFA